jgi:nucleoside-diphosphate-sugar epimerase
MKVLVTGGAGYIGSVLAPYLLRHGHEVRVLDDLREGGHGLITNCLDARFEFVHGDVGDEETLSGALDGADAIVHLAAIVGFPDCAQQPDEAVRVNVEATRRLLALRRPEQRVVFASTGSVYGAVESDLCTEETPRKPLSLYAQSKAEAEDLVLADPNTVTYRYATAFGVSPRMRLDLLPNTFVHEAICHASLTIYESGFRRTLIHVRDVARSVQHALSNWDAMADAVYNVGDETLNISKAELAQRIQKHLDFELTFEEIGTDADQRDYEVSYQRIRSTGYRTTIDVDAGIAELLVAVRLLGQKGS